MSMKNKDPKKVITGPRTRWSFVHVWEPAAINEKSEPKYSVSLIIPKDDKKTLKSIQAAMKAAYDEGLDRLKGNSKSAPTFAAVKKPLHDGDAERPDDEAYQNAFYIGATNKTAPSVVDTAMQPIIDRNEVYSGCYGRASITFRTYNYSNGTSKGIGCYLNHLQKVADGEPLGGARASAEEDFADLDDEDDDIDEDFLWS